MKLRTFMLSVALAASALALVACKDDEPADGDATGTAAAPTVAKEEATSRPSATTSSGSGTATTAPTKAAVPSPTAATGGGNGNLSGSGAAELRELAKNLSTKTYTVTYEYQEGPEAELATGTLTLSQMPPKSATTFTSDAEVFTVIDDGVNSWVCSKESGEAEGACIKSATSGSLTTSSAFDLDAALDDLENDLNVTAEKDEKIAGRDAACFTIKEEGHGESRACFDKKDGFILLLDQTDDTGEKFGIKATNASNSVDDKVFEPMYPVSAFP